MKRLNFNNKIVANYFSALLIILMIPFVAGIFMMSYYSRESKKQEIESSLMQLQQTQELVDRNLLFLRRTAMKVAKNSALLELKSYDPTDPQELYRISVLADDLAREIGVYEFCAGAYVYVRRADIVFFGGDCYRSRDFFNIYVKDGDFESWKQQLSHKYFDSFYTEVGAIDDLADGGVVEYRQSYPIGGENKGTISFLLNKKIFVQQNLEKQYRTDKIRLVIFNKDNQIVYCTSGADESYERYYSLAEGYSRVGRADVCKTVSEIGELKYVLIDNGNAALQKVNKFSLFSILYALLILVLGGFYIFYATKKLSAKSRMIYEFLKNKQPAEQAFDWDSIVDELREVSYAQNRVDVLLSVKNDMQKNQLLINLLCGDEEYVDLMRESLSQVGVKLDGAGFLLSSVIFKAPYDEQPELLKYATQNILKDLAQETSWYFIDYSFNRVMFLFTGNIDEKKRDELVGVFDVLAEFVYSILDVEVEVEFGSVCRSIKELRNSAKHLLNGRNFEAFLADIKNRSKKYYYLQEQENELIGRVLTGKVEDTDAFIDDIFLAHKDTDFAYIRVLALNMLGTFYKCAEKISSNRVLEPAEIDTIFYSQNVGEIKDAIKNIFRQLSLNAEPTDKRNIKALGLKMVNYVDVNFRDPDLSLKMLSDTYRITVPYVSKIFKEQIGCNFSSYLTEKRIDAAKELLKNTSLSISDIAQQVGYIDSPTFIKNFKRVMKMTPGTYREM